MPQTKSWRSQAQFCHQLDRPSATTTKRSDRKDKGSLKASMIAASPSLFSAWRFWASSAYPKEAESDGWLPSLRRQNKTEACGGAHATMHAVALIYQRGRQPVVARDAALFRSEKSIGNTYIPVRNTWFPDRTQIRKFRIQSIRSIKNELFRLKSIFR